MRVIQCYPYYARRLSGLRYKLLHAVKCKRCFGYDVIRHHVAGKSGLEIGGPSAIFLQNGLIPVYGIARSVDNCDFSRNTPWTKANNSQLTRGYRTLYSQQFISDAIALSFCADEKYDFVIASHVVEHLANPLGALLEWRRVLKPEGTILLIVPHRAGIFDRRRAVTPFAHLEQDYLAKTREDDLTHVPEILANHDLSLDPPAGSKKQFRARCLKNFENRCMHHHVFSPESLVEMFDYLAMRVLSVSVERHSVNHIVGMAQKVLDAPIEEIRRSNAALLDPGAEWRKHNSSSIESTCG